MEKEKSRQNQSSSWGTWEELLLASAVKRHGFKNWDSVAMEVQTKSSLPVLLTTADNCQQKYNALHRRFSTKEEEEDTQKYDTNYIHNYNNNNNNNNNNGDKVENIPWLEELRKLRVAELKKEVQRYDISIMTLQLKVKRLEEEREKSVQNNQNGVGGIPDLEQQVSENDKKNNNNNNKIKSVSGGGGGDESDRENRSVNESNSTCSGSGQKKKDGSTLAEPAARDLDLVTGETAPVLSGSNSKSVGEGEESHELGDSAATQLSSDVQSAAASRKRRRKGRKRREDVGGDEIKGATVKSEPLVRLMQIIRSHKHGSLFEGRLESQGTDVYKNVVRQHLDLETIQTRLEQGSYSSSNLSFYRDLLLLLNNAIIFFPINSNESLAAYELRSHISSEMKKEPQKSDSTVAPQDFPPPQPKRELERSDSLLAKQKATAPIVVCRKRSSLSAKPSPLSFAQKIEQQQQQSNDNEPLGELKPQAVENNSLKMESKEKPVTGTRSSRRSNSKNLVKTNSTTPSKKQTATPTAKVSSSVDKPETPKSDKKKTEASALDKKRSAVDFLKRIKKNSPVEVPKKNTRGTTDSSGGGEQKKESPTKGEKGKERVTTRRNSDEKPVEENSPLKKAAGRVTTKKGAEPSKVSGKRGKESGGKEASKRPKKRSRR